MLIIQTDGAFEQKSNKAAFAFRIKDFADKKIIYEVSKKTEASDNHDAEFQALDQALAYLLSNKNKTKITEEILSLQSDSKGLLDAVDKNYSKHYPTQLAQIMEKLNQFSMYYTKLLSDKENKAAHSLAISALHDK